MQTEKNAPHLNRLAQCSSPYLRQHAHNPVDWLPWGEEALSKARTEDKPLLLSLGYSTCHWCHVMAHESFEDVSVASVLNRGFVAVKIDREERPDLDNLYITACQLVRGHAGWPLTVLALPDGRPFFVATYMPKDSRPGRLGFLELLTHIEREWQTDRGEILEAAGEITLAVQDALRPERLEPISRADARSQAIAHLLRDLDQAHGGFGRAPKFPMPQKLLLLLSAAREGHERAREAVRITLDAMANGGIHDVLDGGFHRYSTDRAWKLPHFEKTLYDQALLLWVYAEAFDVLGDPRYQATALSTARFLLSKLRLQSGGLASGLDADSDGEEGRTYLWTMSELRAALRGPGLELATLLYGATDQGNVADEATGRPSGHNVLHRHVPLLTAAARLELTESDATHLLDAVHLALSQQRQTRPSPMRDDKQLADWNAMAAVALLRAGTLLKDASLTASATRIVQCLLESHRNLECRLTHCASDPLTGLGFLDDYAWVSLACLELFEVNGEERYRTLATSFASTMVKLFGDPSTGAFTLAAGDSPRLFAMPMSSVDGALPSGYSVAIHALERIATSTAHEELKKAAMRARGPMSRTLAAIPEEHVFALLD
ncbi:MAG: thioredoxin domain-containing protein [Myxococcota bacterium]|jgi:hypothetical protein|nr:thioredoxin domain-containing protein [Myxococcota bacterium]